MATKKPQQKQQYESDELMQSGISTDDYYARLLSPQQEAAPAPQERTWGEAVGDSGRSAAAGVGHLIKSGGDLYGLATGNMDNAASEFGKSVSDYWEEGQSDALKGKKAAREKAIDQAEGFGGKMWEAIKTTMTDPALAVDSVASNLVTMIPGMAVGRAAGAATAARGMAAASKFGPVSLAAQQAIAKTAGKVGVATMIGVGAVQQGADVAGDVYADVMKKPNEVWAENPDFMAALSRELEHNPDSESAVENTKRVFALSTARQTAPAAAAISVATNAIPGGRMLERALVGGAAANTAKKAGVGAVLKSTAKGGAGESFGEGIEEGGGAFVGNVAKRENIDPNQALDEDVAKSAGLAMVPAALMGGAGGAMQRPDQDAGTPPPAPQGAPSGPLSRAAGAASPLQAAPVAPAGDVYAQRASEVEAAVRDGKLLDALRSNGPEVASDLVAALSVAKNATLPESARQQAVAEIDGIMHELQMRPANAAGQAWQDLGMTTPADDLAAQRAQAEGINTAGQQWQSLGITNPADDLAQQRADHQAGVAAEAGGAWKAMAPGIKEGGDSSGIPDRKTAEPVAAPVAEPVAEQPAAEPAKRRIVEAPKVSVPVGDGPAVVRQRRAQLQAMVADGFGTVERLGDSFSLVNTKRGEEMPLANALEAQMARKMASDYVAAQAATAATSPANDLQEPTQAQAEAGNYKKAPMRVAGADLMIENAAGSVRSGVSPDGKAWSTTMVHHYGYVKRSEGADGDGVDVFVGPRPDSNQVYVVDQVDPKTGKFDEHKVMLGFASESDARAGYLANYESGWKGMGAVTPMTAEQFHAWMKGDDLALPVNKSVPANELADAPGDAKLVAAMAKEARDPSLKLAGNTPQANALRALLRSVERVFGVHGVPVESDGRFDGFEHKGVVYINVDNPIMHVAQTIGHEVTHTQEGAMPLVRDRIWSLIGEAGRKVYFETYLFRSGSLANPGPAIAYKDATPEQIEKLKSEMLADFFGGRFQDKAWLQALAKQKPHLFGEFVRDWLKALKRIEMALREMLGMAEPESIKHIDQYITQLAEAHRLAMEAAIEWAAANPKMAAQSKVDEQIAEPLRASAKPISPKLEMWAKDFVAGMSVPSVMQVSSAPSAPMRMAGLPGAARITIDRFALTHIGKRGHEIDPKLIGRLPFLLAEPRAVVVTYEKDDDVSYTPKDGYAQRVNVLVDERDSAGRPYLVALKHGTHGPDVTDIRTMFGRNNSLVYVLRALREGGFVYANQKEVDRLKAITGSGTIPAGSPDGASTPKSPEQPPQKMLRADDQPTGIVYGLDAGTKFVSGGDWKAAGIPIDVSAKAILGNQGVHFSERDSSSGKPDGGMDINEDLDMAAFLEEVEREAAEEAAANALASAPKKPVMGKDVLTNFGQDVSDVEIDGNGLMAEDAYDDLPWKSLAGAKGVYRALYTDPAEPLKVRSAELEYHGDNLWRVGIPGSWVGPANTEEYGYATRKTAERFAQRNVAATDLYARGFDLRDAAPADRRASALAAWKHLNKLDRVEKGVRRYGRVNDPKASVKEIVDGLGANDGYEVSAHLEVTDPFNESLILRFTNSHTGQEQGASLVISKVGGKRIGMVEASGMMRGGLGAAVYQIAAEFAARRGITIKPDSSISGVNTYRRTEQMLSAALRTGKSNVMLPHPTQRVYGFNNEASSPEEHDENIERLLLAGLRNVREVVPEIDNLSYDPVMGKFTRANGSDAGGLVATILARNDVRSFGVGRSTLARAAVTRMALAGEFNAEPVESFAEPLLYSERLSADLAYQAVEEKYRGTDEWMKAPNGAKTNLTERQWVQVRTPEFKAWFGDWEKFAGQPSGAWSDTGGAVSKVVDENGEPMVVYHGSDTAGFMEFKEPGGKALGDLGIFATNDHGMARSHVKKGRAKDVVAPEDRDHLERLGIKLSGAQLDDGPTRYSYETPEGDQFGVFDSEEAAIADALRNFGDLEEATYGGIYGLFMNIRNPQEEDFRGASWTGDFFGDEHFEAYDADGDIIYGADGSDVLTRDEAERLAELHGGTFEPASPIGRSTDQVMREARAHNDGAIVYSVVDDGGGVGYDGDPKTIFVAFKPAQVKSASFNTGSFSGADGDIRRSERPNVEALQPERKPRSKPVEQRQRDAVGAEEARGRLVSYNVEIEETGETATLTVDAGDAIQDFDDRLAGMRELLACIAK